MVIFCLSCLNTSLSGGGRKSFTISSSPTGSSPGGRSVYFIFFFINFLASAPTSSADNTNNIFPIGKPYRHNGFSCFTNAKIPVSGNVVSHITHNNSLWVCKNSLSFGERNTVFQTVLHVLNHIPFKAFLAHSPSLGHSHNKSNIYNHINIHTI